MTEPPHPAPGTGPDALPVPVCYRHPDRETYISCQRCGRPICPDCMRSAAVGFQCPECVKEGARQTRQGRAAYGGQRSGDPSLTSKVLIGLNALVWGAITVTGGAASRLVDALALLPKGQCASIRQPGGAYLDVTDRAICRGDGRWVPGVAEGAFWQPLTSAFTHVEIWHLALNMLALWVLGPQLEAVLGRARFLAVYLGSALAGSAMVCWLTAQNVYTLGASGAIFGLLGALLVVVVKSRGNPNQLLFWIGVNFLITAVGSRYISWQGHLGGFLGGLVLTAIVVFAPRARREVVQWAGFVVVLAAVLAAIVVRSLTLA